MSIPLRLLIVEDNPSDAELMLHALRHAGYSISAERVETEAEYRIRLESRPDIVLADFSMPEFDALSALDIMKQSKLYIPVIIVSGSIGEEHVVQLMQRGATDYIIKDRMGRLGYAVTQALEKVRLREAKLQAEQALRESDEVSRKTQYANQQKQDASKQAEEKAIALTESLMLDSLRQHEHIVAAENLNAQLRVEIGERERAEEALRRRTDQFETLLNAAPMGVYLVDADFRFCAVNPAASAFFSGMAVIGRDFQDVLLQVCPKAFADEMVGHLHHTLDSGVPYVVTERTEMRKDRGGPEYYEFQLNRIPFPDGRYGVVCYFREISERVLAQQKIREREAARVEELAEADRGKDEFLAMLAHELRNPLVPIKSAAEILRIKKFEDPVIVKVQAILERQANHMTRLVDDLLDSSRIKQRKVTLHNQQLNLANMVFSVLETTQDSIDLYHHTLTVDIVKDPPIYINADPARVAQIITNIVINAVKYTPQHGSIHVSAAREHGMATIRVRDSGIGLEAHMLLAIFDLFTQVEVSLERSQGGLGLGLKLVKELVEMQGGTVEAKSAGKGKGSEFIVRFPEVAAHDSTMSALKDMGPATNRRILLIEDNPDILDCMNLMLTLSGHKVEVAVNGVQGVEKALKADFDVALVDIGLPGMNGYEVAKKLRAQPAGSRMVLIALTGYGQEKDKNRAFDAGFNEHLTKPVDPEVLDAILNGLEKYLDGALQTAG